MVGSSSSARVKCYIILQGLERSLAENILRNYDISSPTFLSLEEQDKSLKRLREDQDDPHVQISDLDTEDLLTYLDLGDLVNLMNRHIKSVKNVRPEHVDAATKLILERGTLSIRKRVMHPIRPLDVDDLPSLLSVATKIQKLAPSLHWDLLAINLRRQYKEGAILDVSIPSFWAEESPIVHNLPPAEFDDTGFIGRTKERKDLRKLLESDFKVITVVGAAGIGKTALSLRVCNDILDESKPLFDRIVWVTLKTRYLTPEGIRQIQNAIDSLGALIDSILGFLKIKGTKDWKGVIEQLKASRTLLVIDNLETVGEEIRDLLLDVPAGSIILLTSRVGLGEIEVRYELSDFAPKDATALFRSLVAVHNCASLKNVHRGVAERYVRELEYNPLLIKWFVLAVCKGADPDTLLGKEVLEEPLNFFYSKIYARLARLSREILSILLAARTELTKAQIQELAGSKHVPFSQAIQELIRTSMVERVCGLNGTMVFKIGGLIYDYLSYNYPPDDALVKRVRQKIQEWQVEQERIAIAFSSYRYGSYALHVEKADERIAAQHLLRALKASALGHSKTASEALRIAEQLTPMWWEVHLVKAHVLEAQRKPIYEVEEAFEQSIRIKDNDVNRYHYAVYLLRQNEYSRVLEQIEKASVHDEALPMTFKSLKGLTLMRMGRIEESINELEEVWKNRSEKVPIKVGRAQGTQLAEAYRRGSEQAITLQRFPEAIDGCVKAVNVVEEVVKAYGFDRVLVETAVNIITTTTVRIQIPEDIERQIGRVTKKWDINGAFHSLVTGMKKTTAYFQKKPSLEQFFPTMYKELLTLGYVKRYTGEIEFLVRSESKSYGFINCNELGRIHFSKLSLVNPNIWNTLKSADVVTFGVVLPENKERLPHAVRLELTQPM